MKKKEYKYKSFTPFNDHPGCKGHANYFLDTTYEREEDRELISNILKNYEQNPNNNRA